MSAFEGDLVAFEPMAETEGMVLLSNGAQRGLDQWCAENRGRLDEMLLTTGAVLFRRWDVSTSDRFEQAVSAMGDPTLDYRFGSTPRNREGKAYTASEYPPSETIPLHNEMSYTSQWPSRVWFWCQTPSSSGGETPLADSRRVLELLSPATVSRFTEHGVRYKRVFSRGIDVPWQKVFETESHAEVEAFCESHQISFNWGPGDSLVTSQVCQAVATHPRTGEVVWFNQAHLFHPSTLGGLRRILEGAVGKENLPRQVMYGDGEEIPEGVIDEIRAAYSREQRRFKWQANDLLLLDNLLVAHGRMPFEGNRRVLVAMT